MKKIRIFYFSGTGNTKYVSDYLSKTMKDRFWDSESVCITRLSDKTRNRMIQESDILFLAYPIYGSDMPDQMRQFIYSLPEGEGKQLGVMATQLLFSGDGSSILHKELNRKGYRQLWGYQINMPNNLPLAGSPLYQSADYEIHEKKHLRHARRKIEKAGIAIDGERKRLIDNTPFHRGLAHLQRPLFRKKMKKAYQDAFMAGDSCTGCRKCVQACPGDVISYDGKIRFDNRENCQVCFRCLNFCPVSAISQNGKIREPLYKGPTKDIFRSLF